MTDFRVVRNAADVAALPPDTVAVAGQGVTDEDLRGLARLPFLDAVHLHGCFALGDAAVEALGNLPGLRKLYLSGHRITDDGLRPLARCAALVELGLDTRCTGAGLAYLAGLPALREIHLPGWPSLEPARLDVLADFPTLAMLCFYRVPAMTPEATERLRLLLPRCEVVVR